LNFNVTPLIKTIFDADPEVSHHHHNARNGPGETGTIGGETVVPEYLRADQHSTL